MTDTKVFNVRLDPSELEALREQAVREGTSMQEVAVAAINNRTHRRAQIHQLLDEIDTEHAETLAALADR